MDRDTDSTGETDERGISLNAFYRALADVDRRRALYYLRERDAASVDELADVLAGWRAASDASANAATPADRRSVAIALHHVHVPALVEAGLVETASEDDHVRVPDLPPVIDDALDAALEADRALSDAETESATDYANGPP